VLEEYILIDEFVNGIAKSELGRYAGLGCSRGSLRLFESWGRAWSQGLPHNEVKLIC